MPTYPTPYPRAPIVEAILDIRIDPAGQIPSAEFERAFQAEAEKYPQRGSPVALQWQLSVGRDLGSSVLQRDIGRAFATSDRKHSFQARIDGFTYNWLAPYDRWESLREEAKRLWNVYLGAVGATQVRRLALRYINRIDLPRQPGGVELKDYFLMYPEFKPSKPVPEVMGSYALHLEVPQPDIGGHLILNQGTIPPVTEHHISIVLDIDVFSESNSGFDVSNIWGHFELLRSRKNDVFEGCITDRVREMIS